MHSLFIILSLIIHVVILQIVELLLTEHLHISLIKEELTCHGYPSAVSYGMKLDAALIFFVLLNME